jgi:phage-related protein
MQKTPRREIAVAERRLADFLEREEHDDKGKSKPAF